jgi:hypothetical protein
VSTLSRSPKLSLLVLWLALGLALWAQVPRAPTNPVLVAPTAAAPLISLLSPNNGNVGASVTITGNFFSATQGVGVVTFNGVSAAVLAWGNQSITVTVPSGATTGNVVVTRGSLVSNGVSFTVTVPSGTTRTVCPSGCTHTTVQAALNAAALGDTIVLEAGVTYSETLTYPNKGSGTSYITITSNASAVNLPAAGQRTGPIYSAYMPKLRAVNGLNSWGNNFPASSHHWRFTFIEFLAVPTGRGSIIQFGDSTATTLAALPHHVIFDRCNFLATDIDGQGRGVAFNGAYGEIRNSYFTNMNALFQDSQCISGNDAVGPLVIDNNYCESGTENIIFGGSDPTLRWRMTATSGLSTTGANVTLAEAGGRTLADLAVGDLLAIDITPGASISLEYPRIATLTNVTATTATMTWTPALSAIPDTTASSIRHDTVINNLTITNNHLVKNPNWRNPILGIPANVAGTAQAGGSLSCVCVYKVVAYALSFDNNQINGLASTEVSVAASGANATARVTWDAVPNAEFYRVWRGTSPGNETAYVQVTAPTLTLTDTGAVSFTAASIPTTGHKWVIKTLFELKAATNWTISGNIMEYSWEDSINGARQGSGWFKSENQSNDGGCWTCTTRDGVMENNIFRHVMDGWSFQGQYSVHAPFVVPAPMTNVLVRNNLIYDCNDTWAEDVGQTSYTLLFQNGVQNMTVTHNTIQCEDGQGTMAIDGARQNTPGFVFINNMILRGNFGVNSDVAEGTGSLTTYAPGYTFAGNAIGGPQSGQFSTGYPTGNFYPTVADWKSAFTNYTRDGVGGVFTIATGHAYKNAGTDGLDIGANIAGVLAATATANPAAVMTSLSPSSGAVGTAVTISGQGFGNIQGDRVVTFNGTVATATSWSETSVVVTVPTGATTGSVLVTRGSLVSNALTFTLGVPLYVNSTTGLDSRTKAQARSAATPWATVGRALWGSTTRGTPNTAEAAAAGDTVVVAAGTYSTAGLNLSGWGGPSVRLTPLYNPVNEGSSGLPITIQVATGATVRLTHSSTGPTIGCGDRNYIIWDGFTLNTSTAPRSGDTGPVTLGGNNDSTHAVYCEARNLTIEGTNIADDGQGNFPGIRVENGDHMRIANVTASGFATAGVKGSNEVCVMIYDADDTLIEHLTCSDTGGGISVKGNHVPETVARTIARSNLLHDLGFGIYLCASNAGRYYQNVIYTVSDSGIWVPDNSPCLATDDLIANNTIYDFVGTNGAINYHFTACCTISNLRFHNNIFSTGTNGHGATGATAASVVAQSQSEHNVYFTVPNVGAFSSGNLNLAAWKALSPAQDSVSPAGISTDPLFVSATGHDFRLCTGSGTPAVSCTGASPAIALGVDLLDLDGDGSVVDLIPAGASITGTEVFGRVP